jgi:hypothetical protein
MTTEQRDEDYEAAKKHLSMALNEVLSAMSFARATGKVSDVLIDMVRVAIESLRCVPGVRAIEASTQCGAAPHSP